MILYFCFDITITILLLLSLTLISLFSSLNYNRFICSTIKFGQEGPALLDNRRYSSMSECSSTMVFSLFILVLLDNSIWRTVKSIKLVYKAVVSRHWKTLKRRLFFLCLSTYISRDQRMFHTICSLMPVSVLTPYFVSSLSVWILIDTITLDS